MVHVFILLCFCLLVGVFGDEVKSMSVMEGDSLTLHTDITEIKSKDEIEWMFEEIRIARIKRSRNINPIYEDNNDKTQIFRDRLIMNNQTGDLTITNTRSEHTGDYKLNIIIGYQKTVKRFNVTVYARLPIPFITGGIWHCFTSNCVLWCSVLNVRDVSLSLYKENHLLPLISESTPKIIRISLQLEVKNQDNNTYSCVVSNPISNKTQHFCLADLCHLCSGHLYIYWLRWAVAGLAGVGIVLSLIVLGWEINSRRDKQKRKSPTSSATPDECASKTAIKSSSSLLSQSP